MTIFHRLYLAQTSESDGGYGVMKGASADHSPARQWEQEVLALAHAMRDVIKDTSRGTEKVVYALDYLNFSPVVWPGRTDSVLREDRPIVRQYDFLAKSILDGLPISHSSMPIVPVMPPTTFLELEKSLNDFVERSRRVSEHYSEAEGLIERMEIALSGSENSDVMAKELARLAPFVPDDRAGDGIDYIISLLEADILVALPEVVDFKKIKGFRDDFQSSSDRVYRDLWRIRNPRNETVDSSFDFKNQMDAFALALPKIVTSAVKGVSVKFCGPIPRGLDRLSGFSLGDVRNPLSLHVMIKSIIKQLDEKAPWPAARDDIILLADKAVLIKNYLSVVDNISHLGKTKFEFLLDYYQKDLGGILDKPESAVSTEQAQRDRLRTALDGGREAFMSRFSSNADRLVKKSERLRGNISRVLPDDVVDFYLLREKVKDLKL